MSDPGWKCPSCGDCEGQWVDCWTGCEDGFFDEYDADPINYSPGEEFATCQDCGGKGGWLVCAFAEVDAL